MIETVFTVYTAIVFGLFIASVIIDLQHRFAVQHRRLKVLVHCKDKESYYAEDQIWLRGGKVIKILTHDGISWEESSPGLGSASDGGGATQTK